MSYTPLKVVLDGITPARISQAGTYFRILESTGDLTVSVDGRTAGFIQQGIGVPVPEGFTELDLDGSAQTVLLAISNAPIDDSRLSLSAPVDVSQILTPVDLSKGATLSMAWPNANIAESLLLPADATRRKVTLQNTNATAVLYIGASTGFTNFEAWKLEPGEKLEITEAPTAAIYIKASADLVNVSVLEEKA